MRRHYLVLFACTSAPLAAQNWALLNPSYKYNYSLGGSDTITDQVFVVHIDTLGTDSFRLGLNPIAERCINCTTSSLVCSPLNGVLDGKPQFMGTGVLVAGSGTWLIGNDTLVVHPLAPLGGTWPSPGGGTGSVTAAYEALILGISDSLKAVQFTDGRSLLLSKDHGLVNYSDANGSHLLIGIQGALEMGAHYPETIDFFDYQPGDVLQYEGGSQSFDGMCYHQSFFTRKYSVLSRADLTDRTDYQLRYVFNWYSYATGGCTGDSGEGVDTVTLSIGKAGWTSANFFAYQWIDRHWPGALAKASENTDPGELGSNEQAFIWRSFVNADGRITIQPEQTDPGLPSSWPNAIRCWDDTMLWQAGFGDCMNRYVEGIGLDSAFVGAFEHTDHIDLVGYMINGQTIGMILPDDIVLGGIPSARSRSGMQLSPNPASDRIELSSTRPIDHVSIVDLQGRAVASYDAAATGTSLDVRTLPSGTYVLHAKGFAPKRVLIAR